MKIRQALTNDIDLITDFTLLLHQHEDDGQLNENLNFKQNLKKWLSLELDNPNSLFLIAEDNSQAIGFIGATCMINDNGFLADPIKGIIQLLWVQPAFRKKNIAKKMLQEVEHCLKHSNVNYIECNFTFCNTTAKNFWKEMGYHSVSITARKIIAA